MRGHQFIKVTIIVCLMLSFSCSTNSNLSSALSDIHNLRVTRNTITKLENAKQTSGCEAESFYNLARIYHFNPKFRDLNQARNCYQKVIMMYGMSAYNSQTNSLSKKYGISQQSLQKTIKDVDELICSQAYADCLNKNTLDGFAKFVQKYPNSSLVNAAKDQALALQQSINTIAGFAEYLNIFPDYRKEEVIQKALNVAKTKNSNEAFQEFKRLFPKDYTREVEELALKAAIAHNDYTTYSEFQSNFPTLCNNIEKTINFMEKEPLDQKGKNTLKSLKTEYIKSATDLAMLNAAVKKYPIVTFNYNEKYYESQSSFDSQLAELESMRTILPVTTIQKLKKEAADRQQQFITKDWQDNPSIGKKVVNGYPNLYNQVATDLYKKIANMSAGTTNYYAERHSYKMNNELNDLEKQIQYCDDFISNFGNSSFSNQARDKRNTLNNRRNYVQKRLNDWSVWAKHAINELSSLKNYVLENGRTPHYETKGNWKEDPGLLFSGYKNTVLIDLGFKQFNCTLTRSYSGEYSTSGYTVMYKNLDYAIRKEVWQTCYSDYQYGHKSDDEILNLIDYLEANKNGTWWGYR